ncbi:ATP-binding cassette domain-containing protein [Latilactobacillus sakei]|uniref:ABC transporter ATP-binding protein n=1 Tax=Latilactobacillus sakei TaxID=1599 RepID=UPI000B9D8199|nr:ABC transporter ATP-binding protein [Latilactobacillus sakei]BAX68787.1 drug ABC exporter, ATP-binding subunit [Latilactobacillus sakei]
MTLLTATGITKKFGTKTAVKQIDLTVQTGQLVAFLGPNGAGKSTTINLLTGTIAPTAGTIEMAGLKPDNRQYQKQIGVVFQKSVLDNQLTVWQNLKSRADMYQGVTLTPESELITAFSLTSILKQTYGTLSGGQRRRVDIARALIHQPKLLFLDEPSTGLDIQTRTVIWQTLNKLRQQQGLTIILTTHYLEEAAEADFVYVIDHSQIIAADTVEQLQATYAQSQLMIETDYPEAVLAQLAPEWRVLQTNHQLQIALPDDQQAITLLTKVQSVVTHFEFRQGNMDDIFMVLTGKEIRQ